MKKLDRVTGNVKFSDEFLGSFAIFQPYHISDHSPCVLRIPTLTKKKPKPFMFFNFLTYKQGFLDVFQQGWSVNVQGHNMFKVVKKLKGLKSPIRKLLRDQGNLPARVKNLRTELDEVQKSLDNDPTNTVLREEEAIFLEAFKNAILDEERFLKQRAKVDWLREGDSSSSYFHNIVKSKNHRSRIELVTGGNNVLHQGNVVPNVFVQHYENLLGVEGNNLQLPDHVAFPSTINSDRAVWMVRDVTSSEIKDAMFSIGENKAPGLDGFTVSFFKKAWDIVVNDVCLAIRDLFNNGKLLKELNHTIIALVPKVSTPAKVNDYRPISCCNVLYKCIRKIITNRIKEGLGDVVSINQSAFVPRRNI